MNRTFKYFCAGTCAALTMVAAGMLHAAATAPVPASSTPGAGAPATSSEAPPQGAPANATPVNTDPGTATPPSMAPTTPNSPAAATPATVPSTNAPPDAAPTAPPLGSDNKPAEFKTLDQEVQGLKKDVIDLNKDLFVLEEELLFPANTQVAVFLSMDVGTFFALDSVTVKIDNKEVTNYLYTAREADALLKGGVHRIYLGNLKVGKHEIVGFFTGKGPQGRDYKRGATINFDKGVGAKYLEFKITDRVPAHQPEFIVKNWE